MRRLALLCVVLSSSISFAQRLPELARPVNYKLTFGPDFEKNIFTGQETISIQILKPTSEIILNAAEIDFVTCGLTPRCIGSAARRVPYPQSTIARIVVCSDPGMER